MVSVKEIEPTIIITEWADARVPGKLLYPIPMKKVMLLSSYCVLASNLEWILCKFLSGQQIQGAQFW